jgi:hypothetical protein
VNAPTASAEAVSLLDAAQVARANGSGHWWYVDPTSANSFAFFAEWFADLRGDPTQVDYDRIGNALAPMLDEPPTPDAAARIIIMDFPSPQDGRIHLFLPSFLRQDIIRQDPAWRTPGALLNLQTP